MHNSAGSCVWSVARSGAGALAIIVLICLASSASALEPSPPITAQWKDTVVRGILLSEYHFSKLDDGTFAAPNRNHNLHLRITAEGAFLGPRVQKVESWDLSLHLAAVRRGGAFASIGTARLTASEGRIELTGDLLTEWFVNEPRGIEHGFTLPSPPLDGDREDPLVLDLTTAGTALASLSENGEQVLFRSRSGRPVLSYAGLLVTDVTGKTVPSRFDLGTKGLSLVIEDREAAYPLQVDPLVTSPDWTQTSDQGLSRFAVHVASAGDVNNDGFDDVIIGADEYDAPEIGEGRIFVYHGSAVGLGTSPTWTAEGDQVNTDLGFSVASAGDVNNDGFADVIVGAARYDNGQLDEGVAFVYYGSATGLNANGTRPSGTPANANWRAEGDQDGCLFSKSVASAGDVNNDGFDDVIIGSDEYTNGQTGEGAAFVFHGSVNGLALPGNTRPVGTPANANWMGQSDRVNADYGYVAASAGDVNGDMFGDIVVGAWNLDINFADEGRVYLYLGSALGVMTSPSWTYTGGADDAEVGISVAAANVNGDLFSDLIVGADRYSNDQLSEGRVYAFLGTTFPPGLSATPDWSGESDQTLSEFGFTAEPAGDVNNDGFGDIVVGAYRFDNGQTDEGRVFVYMGSSTGLPAGPSCTLEINQASANFGRSVGSAGDVNNDNFSDVIVGAPLYDSGITDQGAAFVYMGCADGDRDCACTGSDCNDANPSVFGTPGESTGLLFAADKQTLNWTAPALMGGTAAALRYDTLRSGNPSDFVTGTTCIETDDGPNTTAPDLEVPAVNDEVFAYLVRARNLCGLGSLGNRSDLSPRTGRTCP